MALKEEKLKAYVEKYGQKVTQYELSGKRLLITLHKGYGWSQWSTHKCHH
jgi:hypothetical protein